MHTTGHVPSTPTHNWPGGDHQQNYSHCVHAVQMQSACGISALVMELHLGGGGGDLWLNYQTL